MCLVAPAASPALVVACGVAADEARSPSPLTPQLFQHHQSSDGAVATLDLPAVRRPHLLTRSIPHFRRPTLLALSRAHLEPNDAHNTYNTDTTPPHHHSHPRTLRVSSTPATLRSAAPYDDIFRLHPQHATLGVFAGGTLLEQNNTTTHPPSLSACQRCPRPPCQHPLLPSLA